MKTLRSKRSGWYEHIMKKGRCHIMCQPMALAVERTGPGERPQLRWLNTTKVDLEGISGRVRDAQGRAK